MAKRFVDTGILKHHFTRGLAAPYKLLWVHLLTDCNHAGMWQVDWEIASVIIGHKIDPKKATEIFQNKVVILKDGAIWFLPDFIDFQYGKLNEKNQAHRGIISILKKENLLNSEGNVEPLVRGCPAPHRGAKDKDKDKEEDKDKEKGGAEKKSFEEVEHPYLKKIREDFPKLLKMEFPLTQAEAERLEVELGDIAVYSILSRMANWKKITTNNTSVNLTLRKWYEKDFEKQQNDNSTPGKSDQKFGRVPASSITKYLNRPPLTVERGTGTD